jgi:hypothetical protein
MQDLKRKDLLKLMAAGGIGAATLVAAKPGTAEAATFTGGVIMCDPAATNHTFEIQSALNLAIQRREAEVWIPARTDGSPWIITRVQAAGTGVERLSIRAFGQIRSSIANSFTPRNVFMVSNLERLTIDGLNIYYTGTVNTAATAARMTTFTSTTAGA